MRPISRAREAYLDSARVEVSVSENIKISLNVRNLSPAIGSDVQNPVVPAARLAPPRPEKGLFLVVTTHLELYVEITGLLPKSTALLTVESPELEQVPVEPPGEQTICVENLEPELVPTDRLGTRRLQSRWTQLLATLRPLRRSGLKRVRARWRTKTNS